MNETYYTGSHRRHQDSRGTRHTSSTPVNNVLIDTDNSPLYIFSLQVKPHTSVLIAT